MLNMCKFSKRELEILELMAEGVRSDRVIATNLGMKSREQVAVHRTNARRKIVKAKNFYKSAMERYGKILFPEKKYKGIIED